jgi:hypothetical protein
LRDRGGALLSIEARPVDDAHSSDHPGEAAGGVGTATEAEEGDAVAGEVFVRQNR